MVKHYTHRCGMIWSAGGKPRTVRTAEQDAGRLVTMILEAATDELFAAYRRQLGDLLEATREARAYEKAHPVELAA